MSAPRSIVSGGTGYVGRFIVEELLSAGHAVTVLGRRPPARGFFRREVAFHPLSLDEPQLAAAAFHDADFFVHAAFDHLSGKYRGGEGEDAAGFMRRNGEGSAVLFEAAKEGGVRRAVFLSSRAVYGPRPAGAWLEETDEARPDTLYGEVKLAAERALGAMASSTFLGFSLRVTGVYGPAGQGRPHKWARLFSDYMAGMKIEPRAATEVHGADVASAVRLLLETAGSTQPLYNVSDLVLDRRDILSVVARCTGSANALPGAADKDAVNAMRTERLRALGWQPGGRALLERTVAQLLGSQYLG